MLSGRSGNVSTGDGLPVFTVKTNPSGEYAEERDRRGLRQYAYHEEIERGLIKDISDSGLAEAFEQHFDRRFSNQIKDRQIRAAKELFDGKGNHCD